MMTVPDTHLLIVDDDERLRKLLKRFLVHNGFLVTTAGDAAQARNLLAGLDFDLVVLDVMMPGEDGISLTRSLREKRSVPILMLTAMSETGQRIAGLEAGVDDYLGKPFEPKELLLRINAILRRVPEAEPAVTIPKLLRLGDILYDVVRGKMRRGKERIRLTMIESHLMRIFSSCPNDPVSRERLAMDPGGDDGLAQIRAVDVQITRLRRKIEPNPQKPRYLRTVRGKGYMLTPD